MAELDDLFKSSDVDNVAQTEENLIFLVSLNRFIY